MSDRNEVIAEIAAMLIKNDLKMTGRTLTTLLNDNGIKTNKGEPYRVGGRGTYRAIWCAWTFYKDTDKTAASNIANAYGNQEGQPAWNR